MVGTPANLGYTISDQTVGNILKRHGLPPAPERKTTTTWKEFIRTHLDVLVATAFFTAEVWTRGGLVAYYVLFFIHLGSRKVHIAGMTPHPDAAWMMQIARNVIMEEWGFLSPGQYLIHDRDGKYCPAFQQLIDTAGVTRIPLPPRSPNLNAYAERWVRSVKDEALSRLILFGEASLRHVLTQYVEALSQITENRKVEARKPLIFQDAVFEFYLEKATLRQSPVQHPLLALQQAWTAMRPRISTISEGLLPRSRRAMSDTATSPCRSPLDR